MKPAFTLLELVLVLAILTLIVAVIAPSLQGFAQGRSSKHLATNLITLTNYARTQAITEGRTYRLNYDANARRFGLSFETGGVYAEPNNEFGRAIEVPEGVVIDTDMPQSTEGQYVQFLSTGRTDPAVIRIIDKYGEVIEVACLSATEMFRIVKAGESR